MWGEPWGDTLALVLMNASLSLLPFGYRRIQMAVLISEILGTRFMQLKLECLLARNLGAPDCISEYSHTAPWRVIGCGQHCKRTFDRKQAN